MRRFYLLFYLVLLPLVSSAQSRITYSYDAAGNRIKREITLSFSQNMPKQQSLTSQEQIYSEVLHEHLVKIYPNPTEGALEVSILGLKNTEKCSLKVYTTQGKQIMTVNVNTDSANIDISNHPAGIYLLKITINNSSTTWKIIKK